MYIEQAKKYFELFQQKNIEGILCLFTDNISIRDWEINSKGIEAVKSAYLNIFQTTSYINIYIENLYLCGSTVIGELHIEINNKKSLKVVDVIEFTEGGFITSIRAYKG